MRIHKWLMGFILLGYMPITWGQNCGDCYSCGDYFCNMRYHVYADYLYWNTFRSGIGRGLANTDVENDLFVTPDYSSGYRIGGRVLWNCLDLGVRYTSYDTTTKQFIIIEQSTQQEGPDNTKYRSDFQTVDIELGYLFCFNCRDNFLRPFVGAKLAWIDERFNFEQQPFVFRTKLNDKGYGPYVGAEGKLGFFNWCNTAVGLRTRGSWGLLNGTYKTRLISVTPQENSDQSFKEKDHLISVFEVFVGLDLSYCDFSCFDLNLQIGYELQYYLRDILSFGNENLGFDNIGFGGLVVRFGVYF